MFKKGYCDLGFAKVDTDRNKRRGFPEVIYAPGKSNAHIINIARRLSRSRQPLLITKLNEGAYTCLKKALPGIKYNNIARIAYSAIKKHRLAKGFVLVITAGTSDIPVAEEAALTLEIMGSKVKRLYDVGVAGVHRVIDKKVILRKAKVIVVAAGMEGALASIISGLVKSVVVAVPTSVGYGANFKGLSSLLTMLNSCSPGVAVVNIDNGFGAGYLAALINKGR